ncbi:MAG TPA: hypothetical protein DDZ89_08270 [Clostridiales bacterium]|nr:hypothetical protein [Clostridiales bacterium]
MKKGKNGWILLLLIIVLSLAGGLLGEILSQYKFFSWMSLGGRNGYITLFDFNLNPLLDFHLFKINFGLTMRLNVGSIIGAILAIIIYR